MIVLHEIHDNFKKQAFTYDTMYNFNMLNAILFLQRLPVAQEISYDV